jgi:hypothetical protein
MMTDVRHIKLRSYHDHLLFSTTDERLNDEVKELIEDLSLINRKSGKITCGQVSLDRLDLINPDAKRMYIPASWRWASR